MASYSYPPPGPPPPAQGVPPPPAGYQPQYGAPYRGGGVGGPSRGRGGFHPAGRGDGPSPYNAVPQGYPTPAPGSYGPPAPGSYPPPQQQWHPEQGHHHPPPANPLPPQNYHPNYAPQIYQQPQYPPAGPPHPPYQHGPPPPQPYNPNFPQAPPANGPPPPDWSGQNGHQPGYSGRGRGGGDRGGRAPTMGPPIRIGFDDGRSHDPAQASGNGYPQPYPDPHQPQYPPAPFPSYPPAQPQPPMAGPSYDYYGGGRGRGGFHNNRGGRPHHGHGNDKFRHQKSGGNHVKQEHQKPDDNATGKKKKRKTANTLGLTPGDANGDGEDWENEEEKLRDLLGNEAIKVNDLATWLADRKRMFPTKARIEARKAEAANQPPKEENASAPLTKVELKELEAAKLRKKLQKLESHIKRKREQHDEGDEMRDVDDSSSESSEEEEEKPESLPSKPQSLPSNKADPSKHCKYYSTGGTCGKKGKCRFVHDPEVRAAALKEREANGGRLTLQQRLMLNDKEQEDLTVLKTIQHFKDSGKLGGPAYASAPAKEPSQLPPAPSSLPPHPSIPPKPKTNPDANWPGQQPKK